MCVLWVLGSRKCVWGGVIFVGCVISLSLPFPASVMMEEWFEGEAEWGEDAWRERDVMVTLTIPLPPNPQPQAVPSPVVAGDPSTPSSPPSSKSFDSYWALHQDCRGCHVADNFDAGCYPELFPVSRLSEPTRPPSTAERQTTFRSPVPHLWRQLVGYLFPAHGAVQQCTPPNHTISPSAASFFLS